MTLPTYTPMMQQYHAIKEQYKEYLLFYRMGDFYELFYDDALTAAPVLNIVLTRRNQQNGQDIPMCGVPFHSCNQYIDKLIKAGFKVAICEQLETPEEAKKRGYKAVVKRDVVRIITPGTILEDNLLTAKSASYLAAISFLNNTYSIAYVDITTSEFKVVTVAMNNLLDEINRIEPNEILISDKQYNNEYLQPVISQFSSKISTVADTYFDYFKTNHKLKYHFNILHNDKFFEGFLCSEISACGALIEYLYITQKTILPKLELPKKQAINNFMQIDYKTAKNLEITSSYNDEANTLLKLMDITVTFGGARLLKNILKHPLIDATVINQRLNLVEYFYKNPKDSEFIRKELEQLADVERILARIATKKSGPRELRELVRSIGIIMKLHYSLEEKREKIPEEFNIILALFSSNIYSLMQEIDSAIQNDPPITIKDGGFIKPGFDAICDKYLNLLQNSEKLLMELRDKYRQITGVNNLKVAHNENMGFYIEVTPQQSQKLDDNSLFIRRQTLVSCSRFITEELSVLEKEILQAKDRLISQENEIYNALCEEICNHSETIINSINALSQLDVYVSFSKLAQENNYTRPIVDESDNYIIKNGRHPVVEKNISKGKFAIYQGNDLYFDANTRVSLITGPNMAGKSTYLRQNAIIAIMAQIGSFIPAEFAHIGVIDAVFARIGAADDLAKGQSTFMVEMSEMATILNKSTSKSLVIIDELGRGTSTYDGMAIAASCVEYIHDKINTKCLFATHYHELSNLEEKLSKLKNYTMQVDESNESISFLHKVIPGSADKSYGIFVAHIAGIPKVVINRSNEYLKQLENKERNFNIPNNTLNNNEIYDQLSGLKIDELSPRQALDLLYKLKDVMELS
ncbi:MAG: DNA mismatch repair protein MutS [Sphingobacteriia bacterium]|nr:DNA mismatch repair protein MutS [Sphingobacteriia bacterium]